MSVSFDVFAVSPQGYEVHFQVQGEKLYADGLTLLAQMEKDGFLPRGKPTSNNGHANGHKANAGAVVAAEAQPEAQPTQIPPAFHVCQEHGRDFMKHQKGDQVWYSHRLPDGSYCREK